MTPESGTAPLRVGVVGAGPRGRKHLDAYAELPQVRCTAVCDTDLGAARGAAAPHGSPDLFDSAETLYRSGTVDVVSICAPSPPHFRLAADALASGLHVLCEKPIAQSVAQCDELIRLAAARGLILASTMQSRYFGRTEWLARQLRHGGFGGSVVARGSGWTIHVWDLLLHLLGPTTEVSAYWTGSRRIDADPMVAVAKTAGGNLIALEASPIHFRKLDGHRDRIRISGSRGACAFDIWSEETKVAGLDPGHDSALRADLAAFTAQRGPIERGVPEVADFVRAVLEGGRPRVDGVEARLTIEFISAAYLSAERAGSPVALPLDPAEPQYARPMERVSD